MKHNTSMKILFHALALAAACAASAAGLNEPSDPRYLEGWRMAGANPQRTGWVPEDVPGKLDLEWYRPFEPHISHKVQVIIADRVLYIAAARGLYALDAETGAELWVYPLEMPPGHSPTVIDGVAYVGCFDWRIHAIDAKTGKGLWTSAAADAGFNVNPVVVEGRVYAGNRDGCLYAFDADTGATAWVFETEMRQPILFSCAYADPSTDSTSSPTSSGSGTSSGALYFGCNDGHAYCVDARTGKQVWKSSKLPGGGFHAYWPVIHGDRVILTGTSEYSFFLEPSRPPVEKEWARFHGEIGSVPGTIVTNQSDVPWNLPAQGLPTLDLSQRRPDGRGVATEYLKAKPWRRTYFVLNRQTGEEITYDFNGDGTLYYAPLLYDGTKSGNRTPPVVAGDGLLYQAAGGSPLGGGIASWLTGTPIIGYVLPRAWDEPIALAAGGNQVYFCHSEGKDGSLGSADIITRNSLTYYWYISGVATDIMPWRRNRPHDMYGQCCDQIPPVPYKNRLYLHRWGHALCFSAAGGRKRLDISEIPPPIQPTAPVPDKDALRKRLAGEIEKMLAAGHLRPGWFTQGLVDNKLSVYTDYFGDYFKNPAETVVTLLRALPHLQPELQQRLKEYVKTEFEAYPPDKYAHIGWGGAGREATDLPPEILEGMARLAQPKTHSVNLWQFPPQANYALYQYARVFGNAEELLSRLRPVNPIPTDQTLIEKPYVHNAYIAGLAGIVGLSGLAGKPDAKARAELDRLLKLRADRFDKNRPPRVKDWDGVIRGGGIFDVFITVARNFMFLTPELASCLRSHVPGKELAELIEQLEDDIETEEILESAGAAGASGVGDFSEQVQAMAVETSDKLKEMRAELAALKRAGTPALNRVREAWDEYNEELPYWFVSKSEEGCGENVFNPLVNYHAMFQALAMILKAPYAELVRYLDVPAFYRGDLYYIDNLCAVLEAED